ncbi:MAG TPA: HAD family hydrolase [Burkholderiaceae bacterium]
MTRLALFDLDHTLLAGDSDVLWCEYLMQHGLLDRTEFAPRNAEMARRYDEGSVTPQAFCEFYVSTLAGRSIVECAAWCKRFLDEEIVPRIAPAARALVDRHRDRGDRLVLTTATNRVITELTAQHLRIADLIATEVEIVESLDGRRYSGRLRGVPNMRDGKVQRLHAWLAEQGLPRDSLAGAVAYSDSRNDLPLLSAVGHPVAANPDAHLRAHALAQGWEIVELSRPAM